MNLTDKQIRNFTKKIWNGMPHECWEWHGVRQGGYGICSINYKNYRAHRVAYELFRKKIPDGMVLDHLCRNTICVNPLHLEPVTMRTNTLRGISPIAKNAKKTHCKHGHEFTESNTIYLKRGMRNCRTCVNSASQRWRDRNKKI